MVSSTIKREIQHFGDIVVHGRPAKVQKKVCCTFRIIVLFCRSCCRSHRRILRFLMWREGGYKKTEKSNGLSHVQRSLHNLMRRFMVYVKTQEGFFLYLSKLVCAPKINLKEINLHLTSQPS